MAFFPCYTAQPGVPIFGVAHSHLSSGRPPLSTYRGVLFWRGLGGPPVGQKHKLPACQAGTDEGQQPLFTQSGTVSCV